MTKKEYEEKLTKLENEINELKNVKIEDDEFPRYRDVYWYFDGLGIIMSSCWYNGDTDNYRKDFLRIFKTKEECERYLEIQKAFKEESKKFKPDWNDGDKNKYYLCYDYYSERLTIVLATYARISNVDYFKNKEVLKKLIKRFGKEDIKKYYLGIEE